MQPATEQRCEGHTQARGGRCQKPGKVTEEGKWYCRTHVPSLMIAKYDLRREERRREAEATATHRAKKRAAQAELERRASHYEPLLAALEELVAACKGLYISYEARRVLDEVVKPAIFTARKSEAAEEAT